MAAWCLSTAKEVDEPQDAGTDPPPLLPLSLPHTFSFSLLRNEVLPLLALHFFSPVLYSLALNVSSSLMLFQFDWKSLLIRLFTHSMTVNFCQGFSRLHLSKASAGVVTSLA